MVPTRLLYGLNSCKVSVREVRELWALGVCWFNIRAGIIRTAIEDRLRDNVVFILPAAVITN